MKKKIFSVILVICMLISNLCPVYAETEEHLKAQNQSSYDQIRAIAQEYGYSVTFPTKAINTKDNVLCIELQQLAVILEDLNAIAEYKRPFSESEILPIPYADNGNLLKMTTFFKKNFKEATFLDYHQYRLTCQATAQISYTYFQGFTRFTGATDINIYYKGFAPVEWRQTSSKYNIFWIGSEGFSAMELISYGYPVLNLSISAGISIPAIFTGESRMMICPVGDNEIEN